MKNNYYISGYCHITTQEVSVNGESLLKNETEDFEDFLKEIYRKKQLKYPKFFKMDTLSKLTFLGAEILLEAFQDASETALVFSNRSSSLQTDKRHQKSINSENSYPSPAVFVYTLPNIGMGEVAIRHGLQTENAFFVSETFNAELLQKYTVSLLHEKSVQQVVCGWTEDEPDSRHGFFYLVSQQKGLPHTEQNIKNLFIAE